MTSSTFHEIPCEICGDRDFQIIRPWRDVSNIVLCKKCGLEFVNPMPDDNYLKGLYQSAMAPGSWSSSYYMTYIEERQARKKSYDRQYQARLRMIEKYQPEKGRLLDLGCGAGFFLNSARERGWDCHGIDIVPEFVQYANDSLGLAKVQCGSLEDLKYPENHFQVVMMWDLIEHLPHPTQALKSLRNMISPNGLIVLMTPNAKNAAWVKKDWCGYLQDQHIYYFSAETLQRILREAGFTILSTKPDRAKKGFFKNQNYQPFQADPAPLGIAGKLIKSLKRDLKNTLNPVTYLSPLLDLAGYGFNLYAIARKD